MKKVKINKFRKLLFFFLVIFVILGIAKVNNLRPVNIMATGDLEITYLGLPLGDPIFFLEDTKPGDHVCREVEVANNGEIARFIAVKGVKTGGIGTEPLLEQVLEIVINEDSDVLYGEGSLTGIKTVEEFFAESTDGVPLSVVSASNSTAYEFCVDFPSSAGNEYQEKSVIFDLIFGYVTGENIVINEVYYLVDDEHGVDSYKDRSGINLTISGNGAGSQNSIIFSFNNICIINQSNNANVSNNVSVNANTGNNSSQQNTGGFSSIITGALNSVVNVLTFGNVNVASCNTCCGEKKGQNDEWIELFNPTDQDVNLKNWKLEDNSGNETRIRARRIIKAGGFALISKSSRTWRFWDEDKSATKIRLGKAIGDGLDNEGDHIFLKNPSGDQIDATAWGDDTAVWSPAAVPLVSLGSSMERLAPGFDNDQAFDWEERIPPTPGN